MTELISIQQIIEILIAISAIGGALVWFKKRLGAFRLFVDAVDDALYDDEVDNDEFVKIYDAWRNFIDGVGPKPVKKV